MKHLHTPLRIRWLIAAKFLIGVGCRSRHASRIAEHRAPHSTSDLCGLAIYHKSHLNINSDKQSEESCSNFRINICACLRRSRLVDRCLLVGRCRFEAREGRAERREKSSHRQTRTGRPVRRTSLSQARANAVQATAARAHNNAAQTQVASRHYTADAWKCDN